jgi:hypothetical protein
MLNLPKQTINSLLSFLKDWRGLNEVDFKDKNDFYKNVVIVYNQLFINNCIINSNPYYKLFLTFNTDSHQLATDSLIDNSIKFSFINKDKQVYTNLLHQELIETINILEKYINSNILAPAGLDLLNWEQEEDHLTASNILDIIYYLTNNK